METDGDFSGRQQPPYLLKTCESCVKYPHSSHNMPWMLAALPTISAQLVGGQGQLHALVRVVLAGDVNVVTSQVLIQARTYNAAINIA